MDRMFNKQHKQSERAQRQPSPSFASLTAGLMARKGEAVPAPAHLDGVSIHSHGVARQAESAVEHHQTQPTHEALTPMPTHQPSSHQPAPQPQVQPEQPQPLEPQADQPSFGTRHVPRPPEPAPEPEPTLTPEPQMRETPQPTVPQPDEPLPVPEEALRARALRRATVSTGDCCSLPLPSAVTETLPPGPYAKVTTRLDKERVRKLKILAARMETTNQKVLLAALDHYLDYACDVLAAECPCLARSMRED